MKITIFIVAAIIVGMGNAQNFEGKITYQNFYTSKISQVTSEQLTAMMGSTQEYFIKGDSYKSIMNGTLSQWQLYVPSENKLYSKTAMSDTLFWTDGNSNPYEALSYEIQKDQTEILGYGCDALVVQTKSGKTTYYFSKKIKVDPLLYKNHQYGNWALLLEQTKSLPLKIEMDTPQFTLVSVATEIEEMNLNENFFKVPEAPAKKSPY